MDVLIRPIVTEKFTALGESANRYGFIVDRKANKLQIRKAVEDMYKVRVESVNTMIYRGKTKNRYTKGGVINGRTNSAKKAVVTLVAGDSIDFYSNI